MLYSFARTDLTEHYSQSEHWTQFSRSVISDSLRPHGLQHSRLPCPSPTPRTCSNSCPSSRWCHPTSSSSVVPFSSCLQSFPASGSFSSELALRIRWLKYWHFGISPIDRVTSRKFVFWQFWRWDIKASAAHFVSAEASLHSLWRAIFSLWPRRVFSLCMTVF